MWDNTQAVIDGKCWRRTACVDTFYDLAREVAVKRSVGVTDVARQVDVLTKP